MRRYQSEHAVSKALDAGCPKATRKYKCPECSSQRLLLPAEYISGDSRMMRCSCGVMMHKLPRRATYDDVVKYLGR